MRYRVRCHAPRCPFDAWVPTSELAHFMALAHRQNSGHKVEVEPFHGSDGGTSIRDSLTSNPEGGSRAPEGGAR